MSKQCLDIEQMQHLKELGVDISKAYWSRVVRLKEDSDSKSIPVSSNDSGLCLITENVEKIPIFTLQDILDLLPTTVDDDYRLYIDKGLVLWAVGYVDAVSEEIYEDFRQRDLIDAAYEMLCWCIENGYIKTNKEE